MSDLSWWQDKWTTVQIAMSSQNKSLQLFKELLLEIRTLTRNSSGLHNQQLASYKRTYGYQYISSLYRANKNVCNENTTKDFQFLAETYLCLLKSVRNGKILYQRYKGAGERSVDEIANRVGFKLPDASK